MVEKKLYKTRLCMLYQRGRCSRQYCNFAHGDAELRRSFNEWILLEYRGRDLRERLDRKRSPLRKYSPGRNVRGRHSSHGDSPGSPGKRIDREHRKRQQFDGLSDYSGSLRMSDGTEDQNKERRQTPSDSKMILDEQLRHVHSEIKMLDNEKRQLEIFLEEKVQEADALNLKVHELEIQLSKEKEEAKRITATIKKFVKAHSRHLRLQEDLKRSHAQVQKLGEQLDLDAARPGTIEDDSRINIGSEDENGVNYASPLNECQINSSPIKKRSRVSLEAHGSSNQVNPVKGDRTVIGKTRMEKFSRQAGHHEQLSSSKKHDADGDPNKGRQPLAYEDKNRRGIYLPPDIASADKVSEAGLLLPSTGLAAHATDEDVEVVEMDEKLQVTGAISTGAETQVTLKIPPLPFPPPPPPPVPQNVYIQSDQTSTLLIQYALIVMPQQFTSSASQNSHTRSSLKA